MALCSGGGNKVTSPRSILLGPHLRGLQSGEEGMAMNTLGLSS